MEPRPATVPRWQDCREISRRSDIRVTARAVLSDHDLIREFQARTGIGGKRLEIELDAPES